MRHDRRSLAGLTTLSLLLAVLLWRFPAAAQVETITPSAPGTLLGIYIGPGPYTPITTEAISFLHNLENVIGKRHSIVGTFAAIEIPPDPNELSNAWGDGGANGYVPFLNLATQKYTAQELNMPDVSDRTPQADMERWADFIKSWVGTTNKHVFIAPFQEMNGCWVTYGPCPQNNVADFKAAYKKMQDAFTRKGVPANAVRWVFAPSGGGIPFTDYNPESPPTNAIVDVVGFSAFPGHNLNDPASSIDAVFGTHLTTIRNTWPTKPIFIAQTGACTEFNQEPLKSNWISSAYSYVVSRGVRAVIYFNLNTSPLGGNQCDFTIYTGGAPSPGYQTAATLPGIGLVTPPMTIAFQNRPGFTFYDVLGGFAGSDNVSPWWPWVETIARAGVTGGCGAGLYCPDDVTRRDQMTVFLLRSRFGGAYQPPPGTSTTCFNDLAGSVVPPQFICDAVSKNILSPCSGSSFCPGGTVPRNQMAVMLLRTFEGPSYSPPNPPLQACTIADVPADNWAVPWICEIRRRGITGGCGNCGANCFYYCPEDGVSRGQMSIFLQRTFSPVNSLLTLGW